MHGSISIYKNIEQDHWNFNTYILFTC